MVPLSLCPLVAPVIEWIEEELFVSSMLNKLSLREAVRYTHVPSSHHLSNGRAQMNVVRSVVCYKSQNFLHARQGFGLENAPRLISFCLSFFSKQIEGLLDDIDFKAKVSRQEFEDLCHDLFKRVPGPVHQALSSAEMNMVCLRKCITKPEASVWSCCRIMIEAPVVVLSEPLGYRCLLL